MIFLETSLRPGGIRKEIHHSRACWWHSDRVTITKEPALLSLPEVAKILGVHRATVNDMVLQRKLRGRRRNGRWYVDHTDLMAFASSYKRPSNAPTPRDERLISDGGWQLLSFLVEWDSATTAELDRVVELHIGNIRKQLNMLEAAQLAWRDKDNLWRPTVEGREAELERRTTSTTLEIAS